MIHSQGLTELMGLAKLFMEFGKSPLKIYHNKKFIVVNIKI